MKILVLLRGQPRANANLYHENLKALDEWDADVDVILDGVTTGYQDNILGFTQPGKIHEISDIINNSDVWEDDWYWNEGDGNGPYRVKGMSWTLQLFRYQRTNHKLMLGINQLLAGIHNKIYIESKNKFLFSLLPMSDITHGRTRVDDPIFDYYYDEEHNQKYKFYKK